MIAQAEPQEDGSYVDGGNLSFTTGSLVVANNDDVDTYQYDGYGLGFSFGFEDINPAHQNGGNSTLEE